MTSIYDFSAKTIDGQERPLSDYRGKVLLIVNTASKCGFTPQYKGLEAIHRDYADKGVEVLGFPCNQFGKQEPGDSEEIKNFCSLTYDVSFPMFAKIDVNGSGATAHAILPSQARPVRHGQCEMEFHQIPDRQGWPRGRALWPDCDAGKDRSAILKLL